MFDDLRPLLHSYGERHMITPNLDRLASKSVIFHNANCQVAVCNPSRNSLLTGLRPDTIASYAFSNSWVPHLSFPQQFAHHGYNLASYGKIYHWDDFEDKFGIGYGIGKSDWYNYQGKEYDQLNSTVNPDRNTPEENFRDYIFTTKMIAGLKNLASRPEYFLLGLGYKLPHIHLHFPWKYYDMYRSRAKVWSKVSPTLLQFPHTAPSLSYRCCAYNEYRYLNNEGNARWNETVATPSDISRTFPRRMHEELMWSYSASITFLDAQIGRVLDAIEELNLWNNVTIVLTSDHGMHNGEKGIWEKWTLFEESTRVPLMIYHPKSPYKGQHYRLPVELIDIYPTLIDFNGFPTLTETECLPGSVCRPLNGQSLAPAILGSNFKKRKSGEAFSSPDLPLLPKRYAVTQAIRCARLHMHKRSKDPSLSKVEKIKLLSEMWYTCDPKHSDSEIALMGYSIRTKSHRYTAYVPFDRTVNRVYNLTSAQPFHAHYEELYDHQDDHSMELIDRESFNLAHIVQYFPKLQEMRQLLDQFLRFGKPISISSHE